MLNLRIDIQGQSPDDLEMACRKVLRLIDSECLSGHQKTETMSFDFIYEPAGGGGSSEKRESTSGINFRLPKAMSRYGGGSGGSGSESETMA